MNLQPLADKIITTEPESDTSEKKTKLGIIIPNETNEQPHVAVEVLEVGPEMQDVKKGDYVYINRKSGIKFELDEEKYRLISKEYIVGIIKR